jgi:hypothetical protein
MGGYKNMSISTKEFLKKLRENKTKCFCGHRLLIGRDGIPYCPICNAIHHMDLGEKIPKKAVGMVRFLNGERVFIY